MRVRGKVTTARSIVANASGGFVANLAMGDLASRAGILAPNTAWVLALFQEPGSSMIRRASSSVNVSIA